MFGQLFWQRVDAENVANNDEAINALDIAHY